jgi:hypothetical protein
MLEHRVLLSCVASWKRLEKQPRATLSGSADVWVCDANSIATFRVLLLRRTNPCPSCPKQLLLLLSFSCWGSAPVLAGPLPVLSFPQQSTYELAAAERKTSSKVESKVENTKAWLKTKKTQTGRWMGRQKQKLKQLVD